ncbi:MAG: ATP-dependent helicase [Bacteroides pyogenes]|uniref:ATP-dependent helicase n=1 Tax=Bacteroides pyogenes TaxID=310300 RepID=UPI002A91435F|nr:ATP-dependent helicase [Bacteroides pyogenes]MDY5354751.1 ATP-dependent helicase [Bacteroides pyogenes]
MDLSSLNNEQLEAVTFNGKNLLVLAGAGTGKTRTIIARAIHLINSGIYANRILILSFTRKSAQEIANRIKANVSSSQSKDLTGQTFHSWCMQLITNTPKVFPQNNFSVIDEEDRLQCFKLLIGKKLKNLSGRTVIAENVVSVYSYAVNTQCSLSEAMRIKLDYCTNDDDKEKKMYADIIRNYIAYKESHRYMDYDDILNIVSKGLKANDKAREYISSMYDHILIDEMQDTNPLQYELISSFWDKCHLFCVGDDAQSIYSFRGADFKTIHNFLNIVPNSEVLKLTLNYRSTQRILDLSNWLLSQSPLDYKKELKAFKGEDDNIPAIIHVASAWEEANDITDKVVKSINEWGMTYKDNMVLSRSLWGLRKVEACCIEKKIPYRIYGGVGLMQSKHVRDVLSPMRVVSNYRDELAWVRYLQLWKGIGDVSASKIIEKVFDETNLDDAVIQLMEMKLQNEIPDTLLNIINLQSNPSEAMKQSLKMMEKRLKELYKEEWDWRKDDFPLLMSVASNCGSISEFVAEYVLDPKAEVTVKLSGEDIDYVVLSTIHSAKGTEAEVCYVVDVSTHSYPTPKAISGGEDCIEEERRCLYVALTRAKQRLFVYRDIRSSRVSESEDENGQYYFLNNLPDKLVNCEIIAMDSHQYAEYHGEPISDKLMNTFNFE